MRASVLVVAFAMLTVVCLAVGVSSASASAVVTTIPVGSAPWGVSSDGTHVWVAGTTGIGAGTVTEIDEATGTVVNTIPTGTNPYAYAVSSDGTHVWATSYGGTGAGTVTEIDAASGTVVNMIPVGDNPTSISSDERDREWCRYAH